MYSYSVQQKFTLLGLVSFMKNIALPCYNWIMLNVDFSIGELDRIHSPSLVKYLVLNTFIILNFFVQKFVWLFFFCNLASFTVFSGELYILRSHKIPPYRTSTFLISIFLFMWYM